MLICGWCVAQRHAKCNGQYQILSDGMTMTGPCNCFHLKPKSQQAAEDVVAAAIEWRKRFGLKLEELGSSFDDVRDLVEAVDKYLEGVPYATDKR